MKKPPRMLVETQAADNPFLKAFIHTPRAPLHVHWRNPSLPTVDEGERSCRYGRGAQDIFWAGVLEFDLDSRAPALVWLGRSKLRLHGR